MKAAKTTKTIRNQKSKNVTKVVPLVVADVRKSERKFMKFLAEMTILIWMFALILSVVRLWAFFSVSEIVLTTSLSVIAIISFSLVALWDSKTMANYIDKLFKRYRKKIYMRQRFLATQAKKQKEEKLASEFVKNFFTI